MRHRRTLGLPLAAVSAVGGLTATIATAAGILDLQPFREVSTATLDDPAASVREIQLTNINPYIGAWYTLTLTPTNSKTPKPSPYFIENPFPTDQVVTLDPRFADGVVITGVQGVTRCPMWPKGVETELEIGRKNKSPYVTLCGGKLLLLNETQGRQSAKEWGAAFLRDYVWGGEKITEIVKDTIYQDSQLQTAEVSPHPGGSVARADSIPTTTPSPSPTTTPTSTPSPSASPASPGPLGPIAPNPPPQAAANLPPPPTSPYSVPPTASLDPAFVGAGLKPVEFGIKLPIPAGSELRAGEWYPTTNNPDVFISAFSVKVMNKSILDTFKDRVRPLDNVETNALHYMVAFDLARFDVGYLLGTEHPKVGWSPRAPTKFRDNPAGPDGIDSIVPLVSTGVVPPQVVTRTVAAFTSGFKREHGAFLYGPLSLVNKGSHYGFIVNGVVFSKPQPGLATIIVRADGAVEMRTWRESDNQTMSSIMHLRQNGVAIIDRDPDTGESKPGQYVGQWGPGNWSGSSEGKQRALRAAICILPAAGTKFLVYGYFSSVTPNAMARVLQAYGCEYAMHLDMNALEHTYLALYRDQTRNFSVEHLIPGMNVLDREYGGKIAPRFVAEPDNRDFFYLVRKGSLK